MLWLNTMDVKGSNDNEAFWQTRNDGQQTYAMNQCVSVTQTCKETASTDNGWLLEIRTTLQSDFFCHTMAHRKNTVISLFEMLSTYQILRQLFEMSGSYRKTREPLRDLKFAKSSRVLRKRNQDKLNLRAWSFITCLLWAQILGNAGFYAGPTDDALEEAN